MHVYIKAALHKYQHPNLAHADHAPHEWNPPVYSAKTRYIEETEDSPYLSPKDVSRLQQLCGTILYYARALNPNIVMSVNVLSSEQTRATAETADKIIKLLNYCTTCMEHYATKHQTRY
jgi:hypothetical protein